jgi:uncharacterized protein
MSKLLFWIVIILVALVVARLLAQKAARSARPTPSSRHEHPPGTRPGAKAAPGTGTELMVRCAHCGIQLPTDEAVRRKGYNYCGLAHSLRGPKS